MRVIFTLLVSVCLQLTAFAAVAAVEPTTTTAGAVSSAVSNVVSTGLKLHRLRLLKPAMAVANTVAGAAAHTAMGALNVAMLHPTATAAVVGGALLYRNRHAIGKKLRNLRSYVSSRSKRQQPGDNAQEALRDSEVIET
jgi:hypothetical protein